MSFPSQVTIVEVGPRDGLQNEPLFVPTEIKIDLINRLSKTGLKFIEVTSFVRAKSIPQLADNNIVFKEILKDKDICYSALVPNEQGLEKALDAGVKTIAVFTAASETFSQRNTNCSITDSLQRIQAILKNPAAKGLRVRAYISCALGCPYEGAIKPEQVLPLIEVLKKLSVDEICLGDTIGVGTPKQTRDLIKATASILDLQQLAMHFHDTYGQAIANISSSLDCGVTIFDSSVAGLGGCPYAKGASGNVATEDVLYLMHGLGIKTGIDIYKIVEIGDMICKVLARKNQSKVASALLAKW